MDLKIILTVQRTYTLYILYCSPCQAPQFQSKWTSCKVVPQYQFLLCSGWLTSSWPHCILDHRQWQQGWQWCQVPVQYFVSYLSLFSTNANANKSTRAMPPSKFQLWGLSISFLYNNSHHSHSLCLDFKFPWPMKTCSVLMSLVF